MTENTPSIQPESIVARLSRLSRSELAPEEFFKNFFSLVSSGLAAEAGSLWFYDAKNKQLAPKVVATPPDGPLKELPEETLTKIVYAAIERKTPVLYCGGEPSDTPALQKTCMIVAPVELDEDTFAVVLLSRTKRDDALYTPDDIRALQSLSIYLSVYYAHLQLRQRIAATRRLVVLADVTSELAGAVDFEKMAFVLANRVREVMFFDRTFIAFPSRTGFRIAAVSGVDDVPQKGAIVQNLRDLTKEVARIGGDWHFSPEYLEKVEDENLREKLTVYFETADYHSILLMRIEDNNGLLAIMGFERRAESSYEAADFHLAQSFCKAAARPLRRARSLESLTGISLVRFIDSVKTRATGAGRTSFFVKLALVAAAAAALVFGKMDLSVKGECEVIPHLTTFAAPRIDGAVVEILKSEGESVAAGETIARLDGRELEYQLRQARLEIDRTQNEVDSKLTVDPSAASIARKQLEILNTTLGRLLLRKSWLDIQSPADGVIVTRRDRINSVLNSVVKAGTPVCEVADVSSLLVEIQVTDRDIGLIRVGQPVRFALNAAPAETRYCTVTDISPSTRPIPGKNVFIVRGVIENSPDNLVQMQYLRGSAAVSTGKRPILYCIFRSTVEYVRTLFL